MSEKITIRISVLSTLFKTRFLLIFCFAFSYSMPILAHEPGSSNIKDISIQLIEQDSSPQLYIKRAHLFQQNQLWPEAMSDFNKAAELDPENVELDLDRARLSYDTGEYLRALDFIDLYLLRHESTTEAALIKARSYRALDQYQQSVTSYQVALTNLSIADERPSPEWYLEFSDTLMKTGDKHKALQALQQGIDQLGALTALQVKAVELEVDLGLYNSALKRIDQLLSLSQRKDLWLSRRADILSKAGRQIEAQQTYQQAYVALQSLPQRIQNLPVSRELENTLQTLITHQ